MENANTASYDADCTAGTAPLRSTASIIYDTTAYNWHDEAYLKYRARHYSRDTAPFSPLSICEVHPNSWKKHSDLSVLTRQELADELSVYAKQMGFTHIKLITDIEYYNPILCFGTPYDFMAFTDKMHEAGLGVIIDLVTPDTAEAELLIDSYHIDGFFINAQKSELDFWKGFNAELASARPDILTFSTEGGEEAGFSFNCDAERAKGFLRYISEDPLFRKHHHDKIAPLKELTSKSALIPLSDKNGSIIGTAFGGYDDKFANLRALFAYCMTIPSKKLFFMGSEIAQFNNWGPSKSLEWFLTDYAKHAQLQEYTATLNSFYLEHTELWELDTDKKGFEWLDADNADESIVSYLRRDKRGNALAVAVNFTPVGRENYILAVPSGKWEEIFNSDLPCFGGKGTINQGMYKSVGKAINIHLPPLSAVIFRKIN